MNLHPQFTYNRTGEPVGVFLTIEEWNEIAAKLNLDQRDLYQMNAEALLQAYGENETDYNASMIKEPNPAYKNEGS